MDIVPLFAANLEDPTIGISGQGLNIKRYYRISQFLHDDDYDDNNAKAIAKLWVFSENGQAKNASTGIFSCTYTLSKKHLI